MYDTATNDISVGTAHGHSKLGMATKNGASELKRCRVLAHLTSEQLIELESHSRLKVFAPKSPIYLPTEAADTVLVLVEGFAKVSHLTREGKESILSFIEAGELFGERAIFELGPRNEYVEAIESSKVIAIPLAIMQRLIEKRNDIALELTNAISQRRQRIESRLKNLLFLSNRERLVHLLLDLSEQFGVPHAEGVRLRIKLSHQELANLIGSTRETVTVLLGQLKSENCVTGGRQRIIVTDRNRLAQEVERDVPNR